MYVLSPARSTTTSNADFGWQEWRHSVQDIQSTTPGTGTDDIGVAVRNSKKRVRGAVRVEGSIICDLVLDAILPAVQEAVEQLGRELVGTDWVRDAIVKGVDRDELQKVAYQEIMKGQLSLGKGK